MDQGGITNWLIGGDLASPQKPQSDLSDWLVPAAPKKRPAHPMDTFLDSQRIEVELPNHQRSTMSQWMQGTAPKATPKPPLAPPPFELPQAAPPVTALPVAAKAPTLGLPGVNNSSSNSTLLPALLGVVGQIKYELEGDLNILLTLNPSRREAVAQHLESLANLPAGPSHAAGQGDAAAGLRRWIEGPRSPAQNQALQIYFEEVAMVILGQALTLKSWSDQGLRPITEKDLGDLNWAMSSALKPHLPLDREAWQITRPNLYSWFKPGPSIRKEIWRAFESWTLTREGPEFLATLIRFARRKLGAAAPELSGYDERFFASLWQRMGDFGFRMTAEPGELPRRKAAFSPTLRDGSLGRLGPRELNWVGLESLPFRMITAELAQLWWGPQPPPLWALGTGLEAHSKDQLQLQLAAVKPSLLSRVSEMEACDLGFVLEEKLIRASGRTPEAARYREQLEGLPYFKRLRAPGTTLGDLQACVTLTKLRPGGLLWWAREERLAEGDGQETLRFLLDQGKLLCEWRLGDVNHQLPAHESLFPKYLYLFQRDTDMTARHAHRPLRISLHGQIRSHVEVPILLDDALQAYAAGLENKRPSARGNWQIHAQRSPTVQKEWSEHWPEAADVETVQTLERLRNESLPLAAVTTIRPTPTGDPKRDGAWSIHGGLKGFWFHASQGSQGRKLVTAPLPLAPQETRGHGYIILVPDTAWIAPLRAWVESTWVSRWLEHQCERKGENWVLADPIVKFIPVPRSLLRVLGHVQPGEEQAAERVPLPAEWEQLIRELPQRPRAVLPRIAELRQGDAATNAIRARIFAAAATAMTAVEIEQGPLLKLVKDDGSIRWKEFMAILPPSERVQVTLHPEVRLSGTLPPHLAIGKISRVRAPSPGLLLATESGLNLHLASEQPRLLEILADQCEGLAHPTWHELLQYLTLPRTLDLLEATASDILRCHGEQMARLQALRECLSACSGV